jgi:ADP-heptose:LPS heptosyltransferase
MKKFIIFRTDRLGDFIIITSIIKAIKDKYKNPHITVVGSPYNKKLINCYKIIDKTIIYNKNSSFFEKISIFNYIRKSNYYCSLSLDGKSFSNFVNFFIKSKKKFGISYVFYLFNFIIDFKWSKPNFIYNYLIFNKFEFFTSKKNLFNSEHLPSLFIKLANNLNLNLTSKKNYYYEIKDKNIFLFKKLFSKKVKSKYVLIHLDEKWNDIHLINKDFSRELIIFQKRINKKLVITSNKNNDLYYKNLKQNLKTYKKIVFLENLNLALFERFIAMSSFTISCHSGFLVQISGFNKTNVIDIINKEDLTWYSCWKPLNTKHKFVFKSNSKEKITLNNIFKNIFKSSKKF